MKNKILWIEDDFYAIKGLLRPLELEGFTVDVATSALEGYLKASQWEEYDLIVIDLILPTSDDNQEIPEIVKKWEDEEYSGLGLAKWLKNDLKANCPLLMMSVVGASLKRNLLENDLKNVLSKKNLLPSEVKTTIYKILKGD